MHRSCTGRAGGGGLGLVGHEERQDVLKGFQRGSCGERAFHEGVFKFELLRHLDLFSKEVDLLHFALLLVVLLLAVGGVLNVELVKGHLQLTLASLQPERLFSCFCYTFVTVVSFVTHLLHLLHI